MAHEVTDLGSEKLNEWLVKIGDKHYIVQEAHGDAAVAYRRTMMHGAEFEEAPNTENGKPKRGKKKGKGLAIRKVPTGTAELEPVLVSHCLYNCTFSEITDMVVKGDRVTEEFVRGLPERIIKPIFNWIKENSDLAEDDEEDDDDANPSQEPAASQTTLTTGSK